MVLRKREGRGSVGGPARPHGYEKKFAKIILGKTVSARHLTRSFPSWQSRSALAPRLASPIRVPQVPYSRVLGPRTPATRRNHQQTRNNAASIDMAIVMRIIGKFDRKILVAFHPSIMATERSKDAPGGRVVRPKPLPRPPKSLCAQNPFHDPPNRTQCAPTCI